MNTKEFENISKKIRDAKEERQRAMGALDQLDESLKRDFDINDLSEARKRLDEIRISLTTNQKKIDEMMKELEEIMQ